MAVNYSSSLLKKLCEITNISAVIQFALDTIQEH